MRIHNHGLSGVTRTTTSTGVVTVVRPNSGGSYRIHDNFDGSSYVTVDITNKHPEAKGVSEGGVILTFVFIMFVVCLGLIGWVVSKD